MVKRKFMVVFLLLAALLLQCAAMAMPALAAENTDTVKNYGVDWNDEYIVANVNVMDPQWGVKADGVTDDTAAIQNALNSVAAGGVVYIPAGIYAVRGNLRVPNLCTLMGDWKKPGTEGKETVLLAYAGRGSEKGLPFITMGNASTLKNISIYYPEQTPEDIQPYPYTIGYMGVSILVNGVTLYNSYNGIHTYMVNGSAQHVYNIYGTPLHNGIALDINLEVSEVANVRFGLDIWANSGFKNAPVSEKQKQAVQDVLYNARALTCGRIDDIFLWDVDVDPEDYETGIYFFDNEIEGILGGGTYGHIMNLHETKVIVLDDSRHNVAIDIVDDIVQNQDFQYRQQPGYRTPSDKVISVKDAPYSAAGNGEEDDTAAIQKALEDMADSGGIVYIPTGSYMITAPLNIPTGVELRGALNGPHSAFPERVSQLNIMNAAAAPGGKAAITLSEASGLNGLTITYPEMNLRDPQHYPATIQGNGKDIWIKATTLVNSYDGIDLTTNKCDHFLIRDVWGCAMHDGISVGGGSENGFLEGTMISYGVAQETLGLRGHPDQNSFIHYFERHSVGYRFEDCKNIIGWSVFAFGNSIGAEFGGDKGEPRDLVLYRLGLDTPPCRRSLSLRSGDGIHIYGLSTASNKGPGIVQEEAVKSVDIYGQNIWGGCVNDLLDNGCVRVYNIQNFFKDGKDIQLVPKEITSSSESYVVEHRLDALTDALRYTYWESEGTEGEQYITVEFKEPSKVETVILYHAGTVSGLWTDNTSAYSIEYSDDNTTYHEIIAVKDNLDFVTEDDIPATTAKFFRIRFHKTSYDGKAPARLCAVKLLSEDLTEKESPETPDASTAPSDAADTEHGGSSWALPAAILAAAVLILAVLIGVHQKKIRKD